MTPRIGILGGGQLGLMLAESLQHLGADVTVLEKDPDAPCARRLAGVLEAPYDDAAALKALFGQCTTVTFDSENVPSEPLEPYSAQLKPSLEVLRTSQHRALEKKFLEGHGFRTVRHQAVEAGQSIRDAAVAFGFPCIVKSVLGGYDGKGQAVLRGPDDCRGLGPAVLEEKLELQTEVSCIVARGAGHEQVFEVFENLHHEHILDFTLLPARISPELQRTAKDTALRIARELGVEGLLTVEFFVAGGQLYVNELAPRTHNSGHVTREACSSSQFDALARILCGLPPPVPRLNPGAWVMGQLLGDVWLAQGKDGGALDLSALRDFPEVVEVYTYGKLEARPKRKMGHFVVRADTIEVALAKARALRAALVATAGR
ncbi:MAG: ATP-grasp domain-containing protein [Archangiaceae bacterium]|nr:ATP-grasp domain-containing protein [Archangiaceae bacterium]